MKKGVLFGIIFGVLLLSSVSFVSAGFWDWWTEENIQFSPVEDGTDLPDGETCRDTDGGVYSVTPGAVIKIKGDSESIWKVDKCRGSARVFDSEGNRIKNAGKIIREYYCNDGKLGWQDLDSEDLGEGYCMKEEINVLDRDSAKWVLKVDACFKKDDRTVVDESGNSFRNGCYNDDGDRDGGKSRSHLIYKTFSCGVDGEVIPTEVDCADQGATICDDKIGCVGVCTDNDDAEDMDVPGIVSVDGQETKDKCIGETKVQQYSCSAGKAKSVGSVSCGADRECVVDSDGVGYCQDKPAACTALEEEVKNENGERFRNGCYDADGVWTSGGDDKKSGSHLTWKTFSCGADGRIIDNSVDCVAGGAAQCHRTEGCVGVCTDNEEDNEKDVPGTVLANGEEFKDTCIGTTKVKQYSCSAATGKERSVSAQSCGADRECVVDSDGVGYCQDKFAEFEDTDATLENLQNTINDLLNQLNALDQRIAALEA